jgi:Tol biopolymer transport system component
MNSPSPYRSRFEYLKLVFYICVGLLFSACTATSSENSKSRTGALEHHLGQHATSPDGKKIVFTFVFSRASRLHRGAGILDLATGEVTRIPNPQGSYLGSPVFSSDPMFVYFSSSFFHGSGFGSNIILYNLQNNTYTDIVSDINPVERRFPGMYHEEKNILLYSQQKNNGDSTLWSVDKDGNRFNLLSDEYRFNPIISSPFSFLNNTIYFQARGPENHAIITRLNELNLPSAGSYSYKLRVGHPPELAFPELETRRYPFLPEYISNVKASLRQNLIFGISHSEDRKIERGQRFYYDIFSLSLDGTKKQITQVRGMLSFLSLSADGSVIAFCNDTNSDGVFDLFVFDRSRNIILDTQLVSKLSNHVDFQSY